MASESQVVLDVDGPQVKLLRENVTSDSSRWRKYAALLLMVLCTAAGVVCFSLQTHDTSSESDDMRLTLRQLSQTAKAAIHLTGKKNKAFQESVQWLEDQDQAFNEGFKLHKNEIVIPHNGIYFVYSQASYRLNCAVKDEEESVDLTLTHTVLRSSESYNKKWKPLLNSVKSACKTVPGEDDTLFTTIYLGAAFKLHAGDRLKTNMGKDLLPKVEDEDGKTFFGVFAL